MSLKIICPSPLKDLTTPLTAYEIPQVNEKNPAKGNVDRVAITKNVHRPSNKRTLLLTASAIVVTMVIAAILVSMLLIGVMYLDQCPADRRIPIFLIVCSWICLLIAVIEIYNTRKDRLAENLLRILQIAARIFLATWFIAGCVWVYSVYEPEYFMESSSRYCHRALYFFVFAVINSTIICVVISACLYLRHRCLISERKMKGMISSFRLLDVAKPSLPAYCFRRTAAMIPTDKFFCSL